MKKFVFVAVIALILASAVVARADLRDNGKNFYYDTDLDITWYFPGNDQMPWPSAGSVAALTLGAVGGWRLPTNTMINSSGWLYGENYTPDLGWYGVGYDGSKDVGYNVPGSKSEFAHLYYELGNTYGGVFKNYATFSGVTVTLTNLLGMTYWMGTSGEGTTSKTNASNAFAFNMATGLQYLEPKLPLSSTDKGLLVIYVHDGDIHPTPIPGAVFLLAPGLVGLIAVRRRMGRRG